MFAAGRAAALIRFVLLFAALYAAFGVASPFLPAFLSARGLHPEQIGLLLATGTAVRLISGPAVGRLSDRLAALRPVLGACAVLAALVALCYVPAAGLPLLLMVGVCHAGALAPITTLADALALRGAARGRSFEYGWVRGAGSAAFIIGSVVSGHAVGLSRLSAIFPLQAGLLGVAACCALLVPDPAARRHSAPADTDGTSKLRTLLALPGFVPLMAIAALVLGSHAMHDAFAVIRWNAAGIGPGTAAWLWSESVAAEVIVFFVIGPLLVDRLGPAHAMALAAAAGVLRWSVMGVTTDIAVLALIEPLHGLTFALLHLACMRVLARIVPAALAATAQAIYGTLVVGAATGALTFISGLLFGRLGAHGFWVMAALCAAALPLAHALQAYASAHECRELREAGPRAQ